MTYKNKITFLTIILAVVLTLSLALPALATWQDPVSTPPACNPATDGEGCNPPINVGSGTQTKDGALAILDKLWAAAGLYFFGGSTASLPNWNVVLENTNSNSQKFTLNRIFSLSGVDTPLSLIEILTSGFPSGTIKVNLNSNDVKMGTVTDNSRQYGRFLFNTTNKSLDIYGYGASPTTRKIRLYDNVEIPNGDIYAKNYFVCVNNSCNPISSGGGSQWETNGTKIYYRGGNVGIGTGLINPTEKLEVDGIIRGLGDVCAGTGGANGLGTCLKGIISSPWGVSGNNVYVDTTKSVGIGTASPTNSVALDVHGTTILNGVTMLSNGFSVPATGANSSYIAGSQTLQFGDNPTTDAGTIAWRYKSTTGLDIIGDGPNNQSNRDRVVNIWDNLKVAGTTTTNGLVANLICTGTGACKTTQNIINGGGSNLPTGTANQTLRHNGTNWIADSLLKNSGSQILIGDPVAGSGKLRVKGGIETDTLIRTNELSATTGSLSNLIAGTLSVTGNMGANGAGTFQGGVGIGTSDLAGSKLNVNGTVRVAGSAGTPVFIGDMGCGSPYNGISFGTPSGCSNYSLLGNGKDTYINRPTGGNLYLREGNANQMIITGGSNKGVAIKDSLVVGSLTNPFSSFPALKLGVAGQIATYGANARLILGGSNGGDITKTPIWTIDNDNNTLRFSSQPNLGGNGVVKMSLNQDGKLYVANLSVTNSINVGDSIQLTPKSPGAYSPSCTGDVNRGLMMVVMNPDTTDSLKICVKYGANSFGWKTVTLK